VRAECGFDLQVTCQNAIELVTHIPGAAAAAITSINDPAQHTGERWSASMYVWHLVDVSRIAAAPKDSHQDARHRQRNAQGR